MSDWATVCSQAAFDTWYRWPDTTATAAQAKNKISIKCQPVMSAQYPSIFQQEEDGNIIIFIIKGNKVWN